MGTSIQHDTLPEAYSLKRFGELYNISHTFIYELLKTGRLKARKAGSKTLILRRDAEEWANSLPVMRGGK